MTYQVDPGSDANSYIDGLPRKWRDTAGLWKAKDLADLSADSGTLATRTAERDAARNGLYVSGTYLSGNTWQAQDAIDAAAAAAELTPVGADVISGSAVATTFANATVTVMSLTVDRTGYWLANYGGVANATAVTNGDHVDLNILYNGVGGPSNSITYHAQTFGIFVLGTTPIFITSGQVIAVTLIKTSVDVVTMTSQNLYAVFVPRQSNPR